MPPVNYVGTAYEDLWEILGDGIEEFFAEMEDYNNYLARVRLGLEE